MFRRLRSLPCHARQGTMRLCYRSTAARTASIFIAGWQPGPRSGCGPEGISSLKRVIAKPDVPRPSCPLPGSRSGLSGQKSSTAPWWLAGRAKCWAPHHGAALPPFPASDIPARLPGQRSCTDPGPVIPKLSPDGTFRRSGLKAQAGMVAIKDDISSDILIFVTTMFSTTTPISTQMGTSPRPRATFAMITDRPMT